MRELGQMETQLRNVRENRDRSTDDVERESYQSLIKIYTSKVKTMRTELEVMESENTEQRRKEAEVSSWRRMGKAMVSKTLEQNPDMFDRIRDSISEAAETTANKQAFLAGVGSGLKDLTRSSRKKTKVVSVDDERRTSPRLVENESSVQGRENSDAEDSDGGMGE